MLIAGLRAEGGGEARLLGSCASFAVNKESRLHTPNQSPQLPPTRHSPAHRSHHSMPWPSGSPSEPAALWQLWEHGNLGTMVDGAPQPNSPSQGFFAQPLFAHTAAVVHAGIGGAAIQPKQTKTKQNKSTVARPSCWVFWKGSPSSTAAQPDRPSCAPWAISNTTITITALGSDAASLPTRCLPANDAHRGPLHVDLGTAGKQITCTWAGQCQRRKKQHTSLKAACTAATKFVEANDRGALVDGR